MKPSTHKHRTRLAILGFIVFCIVLILGVFGTMYVSGNVDSTIRTYLQTRARNVSVVVNPDEVKALSGSALDLTNPSYIHLKSMLTAIRGANTDIRFVYLMGLRDGKQFFYVDSEDSSSKDYSAPGSLYPDATQTDLYNHSHGISYTNGPYKDEWGTWVSAYAPILDKDTGAVLALVGVDADASHLLARLSYTRIEGGLITLLLSLLVLLLVFMIRKSNRFADELEEINTDLILNKQYLLEVEDIANMGHFTWDKEKNEVHINQVLMDFLSTTQPIISTEYFIGHMNDEDIALLKEQMNAITPSMSFVTFKYHLTSQTVQDRPVMSICKIKRNLDGDIVGTVCTVSDITNQK